MSPLPIIAVTSFSSWDGDDDIRRVTIARLVDGSEIGPSSIPWPPPPCCRTELYILGGDAIGAKDIVWREFERARNKIHNTVILLFLIIYGIKKLYTSGCIHNFIMIVGCSLFAFEIYVFFNILYMSYLVPGYQVAGLQLVCGCVLIYSTTWDPGPGGTRYDAWTMQLFADASDDVIILVQNSYKRCGWLILISSTIK